MLLQRITSNKRPVNRPQILASLVIFRITMTTSSIKRQIVKACHFNRWATEEEVRNHFFLVGQITTYEWLWPYVYGTKDGISRLPTNRECIREAWPTDLARKTFEYLQWCLGSTDHSLAKNPDYTSIRYISRQIRNVASEREKIRKRRTTASSRRKADITSTEKEEMLNKFDSAPLVVFKKEYENERFELPERPEDLHMPRINKRLLTRESIKICDYTADIRFVIGPHSESWLSGPVYTNAKVL